jgi:tetratricopeptide (TPR) repeat protein
MTTFKRDQAIELMRQKQFDKAFLLFKELITQNPHDGGFLYMAGQCCRFLNDIKRAVSYLQKAREIDPQEPSVLLALGIAFQLNNQYEESIEALNVAIELDPDYELAYNSLALTQGKQGDLAKALDSYDAASKALARRIVKSLRNDRSNPILKHVETVGELWLGYASYAAMYLVSLTENIQGVAWPTSEQAREEERTERHAGFYWADVLTTQNEIARLFLPNYFNTFRELLRRDATYANLIGSRGTDLEKLGRQDEAHQHFAEANEFLPVT